MITANQLYKQSNSSLTFKQWLKENQERGLLDNHEAMYNMIDGEEEQEMDEEVVTDVPSKSVSKAPTTQKSVGKMSVVNIVGIIGVIVLIYGITKSSAE